MPLRTQLKDVKVKCQEKFNDYFTRISHIKERLEAVEDNVKEAEAQITILNSLPNSVERFVLVGISHMEECTIDWWKIRRDDNQALTTAKQRNNKKA